MWTLTKNLPLSKVCGHSIKKYMFWAVFAGRLRNSKKNTLSQTFSEMGSTPFLYGHVKLSVFFKPSLPLTSALQYLCLDPGSMFFFCTIYIYEQYLMEIYITFTNNLQINCRRLQEQFICRLGKWVSNLSKGSGKIRLIENNLIL